ncbi:MAG: DUF4962 domain-containing protein [Kiritimatiellae bacterium]|nr:DUF4962 domain-containing protein [Kiritimatiellia bacterium]
MQFPVTRPDGASWPRPEEGETVGINPPGFCWWRADGAAHYVFRIGDSGGKTVYEDASLTDPVHVPARTLEPGRYRWSVTAVDGAGQSRDTWGPRSFTIAADVPLQPWVPVEDLLARVPAEHPRVIFMRPQLDALRASAKTSRAQPVAGLLARAEKCLALELPEEPAYDKLSDPAERRMTYKNTFVEFRGVIDGGMEPLALAYLFTGDENFGRAALRLLTGAAKWDPEGISSILAPYGDELGLSLVKMGAHGYDWLYDLMGEQERELVRRMLIARANQMLRRLRERRDFLAFPAESHAGRLPGYLCEHAIALAELPESRAWLDYALRTLMTVFPHWGGRDGGWAEGIGYGCAYNAIFTPPFEAVRTAMGLDLWQRPFFRKVRHFFFCCTSPVGEISPFGDGGTGGGAHGVATLLTHHAQIFRDGTCRWWAQQAGRAGRGGGLISLILPDETAPCAPQDPAQDAVFRGVGWAALHSDIGNPGNDTFVLFKSSPYGSVSHSHADQNTFCVMKGGRALAMPSGYYGPAYGMPHHSEWTRQTKAHCGILVNGEGQIVRSQEAAGRIEAFRTGPRIGCVRGDAVAAYGGRLTKCVRHVILVRPGLLCVVDELAAPGPAVFQWLLHAKQPFELDDAHGVVVSTREAARMTVHLRAAGGLTFSQTDRFDTPYNEGNPAPFHRDMPNHHHFAASTAERAAARRIAAFAVIEGPGERFDSRLEDDGTGRLAFEVAFPDGTARVSVPPEGDPVRIRAEWRPGRGQPECVDV